jgi:S-formylglutathione hydrolase FrmB
MFSKISKSVTGCIRFYSGFSIMLIALIGIPQMVNVALAQGVLVTDTITSPALEGNLLGDPAARNMTIYLPPGYDTSDRRYPVLYLMPGLGANDRWWAYGEYSEFFTLAGVALPTDFPEAGFADMIDDLIAAGQVQPMIIVMPDISTMYGGSFCVNSELNGNYEDYIIQDIIPYIDANYRTLPDRDSRGIAGHCMGGYCAMYLTMRHPDVFGAAASHSGMISIVATVPASLELIAAENPDGLTPTGPDPTKTWTTSLYTLSAAWSPNPNNPPFFVDLPVDENLQVREDVLQRWAAHDPAQMIPAHISDLASLRGIYMDGGDKDELGLGLVAQMVSQALSAAGIENQFEMFDGMHMDKMYTRLAVSLRYLSDALVAEEVEDYTNVFFTSLSPGLSMISLPLKPGTPYNARSFAEEVGATVVIRYDELLKEFKGFALGAPGDGFAIEGGKGYIVNVPEGGIVAFTGAAWTNESPVEMAPPIRRSDSAWAFVVSGSVLDGGELSASDGNYTVTVRNLRTGETFTEVVDSTGYFAAAWADLTRKAVVEVGHRVEVTVMDSSGNMVSGPYVHEVTLDGIRDAVVNVCLRLGHIIPEKPALLQNYPNPFNPETWIPFHLNDQIHVSIRIYSAIGQLVRTLDLGHRDAGAYVSRSKAAYWDGRNEAGEEVTSGIYYYTITAGDFSAIRKMVVTK